MHDLPGTQDSLWMATSARRPRPPLVGDAGHVDVAVVGAGITGLTTALLCKREGLRVAVLEMGEVCQGVTGYTTAKVSALHELVYAPLIDDLGEERARAYADANAAAVEGIAQLVSELSIPCAFERRPALTWTEDPEQADALRREAEVAAQLGLPARFTETTDLPFPVAGAVVLPGQAQFHPRDYVLGLADAVHQDGSVVAEHCRVLDVDAGDPHRVDFEGGELFADHVVLATHMPFLDRGGLFAKAHPSRSYCLSAVVDGPVPESMAINLESPTRSVRSYTRDGVTRIVVSGGAGHKPGDDPHEPRHWADLLEWAHTHFPVAEVDYRWSAQDYVAVDGMPYIGRLSRSDERLWTATGYRKWGMTNGTAAARILTDGIVGRDNAWSEAFSPNRVTPAASAARFVKENVQVAAHFVGDRLGLPGADAIEELGDGDGVVCRVDGEAYAVCRVGGTTRAVSPVCSHMGCHVAWNPAEASWDCPCHGSRFDADGTVIQGPATTDLAGMDLPGGSASRPRG